MKRFLRAMVGLRPEPSLEVPQADDESIVATLIENGSTETMAMGAWMPVWAVTGGLLLLVGQIDRSWDRTTQLRVITLAAALMAISVTGFIIHMVRAGAAVSHGRNLAVQGRPPGAYARVLTRLTAPSPWVLMPQIAIGIALALALTPKT